MKKKNKRLLESLRQQLEYEIVYATDVSNPYYDAPNKLDIVDFEYRGRPCRLALNGKLMLETPKEEVLIKSYQDLVQGLIQSNYAKKKTA